MLFDEPLSNLDARLRDQVRTEIHELHGRLGFTAVFVTHDQSEALALGDRLAIMRAGASSSSARPRGVFEQPATEYVAGFIGMSNRLVCERADDGWGWPTVRCSVVRPLMAAPLGGTVAVRLRPEDVAAPAERRHRARRPHHRHGHGRRLRVRRPHDGRRRPPRGARVSAGPHPQRRRAEAGPGGWPPASRVIISFGPADAMLYEARPTGQPTPKRSVS